MSHKQTRSAIDMLLEAFPHWRTARIAFVTNQAAVTAGFRPSRQALQEAGFGLVKLFSPEHGLSAMGPDGQRMRDGVDGLTGLPVISLYGSAAGGSEGDPGVRLAPREEDLADVDLVLFDIPDIGSRFYTYLWTMTHVLEACARFGRPFVVADRPNPLSGRPELAEGRMLDEAACGSFIGRWSIPVRHSCTIGELAGYFNATRNIGCELEVVRCPGWQRSEFFPTERSFVPLSPAISGFESALLYPGLCLFEATNLSEGRGTATPFRAVGAPWMRAGEAVREFERRMNETGTRGKGGSGSCEDGVGDGVVARGVEFVPAEGKYAGQTCAGVMLHVTNASAFRPVEKGCLLLAVIRELHPAEFEWAPYPTLVNPGGVRHLDLLLGMRGAEKLFESGVMDELAGIRKYTDAGDWAERIRPFLLYP
jgi:uncharacterized protein YbbC (DUF1343 family)